MSKGNAVVLDGKKKKLQHNMQQTGSDTGGADTNSSAQEHNASHTMCQTAADFLVAGKGVAATTSMAQLSLMYSPHSGAGKLIICQGNTLQLPIVHCCRA